MSAITPEEGGGDGAVAVDPTVEEEAVDTALDVPPRHPDALPPAFAAALVFIASGAVLMLEILAVRLLAPYVGLTLETTTSIIGAVLAGIAAGAAIGGHVADRVHTRTLIVGLLVGGGLYALLTVPLVRWLGPGARGDGDLVALAITVIALVPSAAALSAVSPAVARLQLHDLRASGSVVGRLSAWATAGALVGTFGTGFVLVPAMTVTAAVLVIGGVLVLTGIALALASRRASPALVAGAVVVVVATVALGGVSVALDSPCEVETRYHCVSLERDPDNPNGRHLLLDDLHHSYVDLKNPTYLEYPYVMWIVDGIGGAMGTTSKPIDAVFVGGGGFTLPRWLLAARPGSTAHVLEVDSELVDFVKERLALRPQRGLQITEGDARVGLLDVDSASADVVVGDAFGNLSVPWHLATAEWAGEIKRVLRPGGLYALNVIDTGPLDLLRAEAATLLDSFAHVRLVTYADGRDLPKGGNAVLFASDRPMSDTLGSNIDGALTYGRPSVERFAAGASVLRDDAAPADQLLTPPES
jgi:MFS family permease